MTVELKENIYRCGRGIIYFIIILRKVYELGLLCLRENIVVWLHVHWLNIITGPVSVTKCKPIFIIIVWAHLLSLDS